MLMSGESEEDIIHFLNHIIQKIENEKDRNVVKTAFEKFKEQSSKINFLGLSNIKMLVYGSTLYSAADWVALFQSEGYTSLTFRFFEIIASNTPVYVGLILGGGILFGALLSLAWLPLALLTVLYRGVKESNRLLGELDE